MNILSLAFKNIKGSSFRSSIIFLCVLGVAVFSLSTTLLIKGAERSLNLGLDRLGADIVVVPSGAEAKIESALLLGKPTNLSMPADITQRVAQVSGVASVSPQVYLASLYNVPCCAVPEMFVIVYDPATDFTVTPWLRKNLGRDLAKGEVVGGSYVFAPESMQTGKPARQQYIVLYGYTLTLKGNLEATGTGLDQTMFMTTDTARAMAVASQTTAVSPLRFAPDRISSVMVKIAPGADRHKVAQDILVFNPGVTPIESPNLFGVFRTQMTGLLWGFLTIMTIIWVLSAVLIGLVFSMAANERRREIAVLRALGATRSFVFRSALAEAAGIALGAGVLGIILASFLVYLFRDAITGGLGMPFVFPDPLSFVSLALIGLAVTLGTVTLAAMLPALRISREEPAMAMRE